jgi:hypothetical protein
MTLKQAIERYRQYINFCEYQGLAVQKEELEQMTAWLRELQERRKAPEIITCGECIHRFVEDENEPFNCCTLDHNDLQSDDWYCADAERRTNDYSKIYNKP